MIQALAHDNLAPAPPVAPPPPRRPWLALARPVRLPAGPPTRPPLPAGRPRAAWLRDWELSELALVPREALTGRLGVPVLLPPLHLDDSGLVAQQTQHVTRFAEMATHLTREHT